MGRAWRDFFYYSKADRRAVLLLVGVLVGIVLTTSFFLLSERGMATAEEDAALPDYGDFLSGLQTDSAPGGRKGRPYAVPVRAKPATFFFDPNTADSATLLRLGLTPWQVRNIYKYRVGGGRYHRPEDFSRLYGLTKEDYDRLSPYIRIADKYKLMSDLYPRGLPETDTVKNHPPVKKNCRRAHKWN